MKNIKNNHASQDENYCQALARKTDLLGVLVLILLLFQFSHRLLIPGGNVVFRFVEGLTFMVVGIISAIFVINLSEFVDNKEVKRRLGLYKTKRWGEAWVLLWGIIAFLMIFLCALYPNKFFLPTSELTIVFAVVFLQYLRNIRLKSKYGKNLSAGR